MRGRRSERVYAVRAAGERWAFVPHPEVSGWWFRTDLCVLVVRCTFSGCGAERGQPCKSEDGYKAETHYMRRAAAKKDVAQLDLAHGIVMNIERPKATTPFDLTPAPLVGDPLLFDT